ncbi:hypothetical protein CPB85DRAFT_1430435 [Mucidula mucida]|nr:hypothetical protein CPB85DRAFT_1430435 [Mucidula mucida]
MSEPQRLLFQPRKGRYYRPGDYKYACKQQPLPMEQLPEYLHTFTDWTPPKLWLAWPSDIDSLLKCIEEVYPSRVMRTEDGKVIKTTVGVLPDAICREFVPQTELHDCVQMAAALAVGCTHIGRLSAALVAKIQAKLRYEEPPKWYLDPYLWKWRKRLPDSLISL